jgi:flagellar basal-body rod protein FlgG
MISGSGISIMVQAAARQTSRLDNTTHNITNAGTAGFKAEQLRFLDGITADTSAQGSTISVDYSQGGLHKTGNILDLAIRGEGFFSVQTKDGVAYTRDGRMTLNENGELVSLAGEYILGEGGKITVSGRDVQIGGTGIVRIDGNEVDTLKITNFQEPSALVKLNARLYRNPDDRAGARDDEDSQIKSGYLELSNVQAVQEMVEMINIQRTFESYQKAIQTIDDQNEASTGRIGRL